MSNNYIAILGLLISLYIVCNAEMIRENWNMSPMMPKITQTIEQNGQKTLLPQNTNITSSPISNITSSMISYPSLIPALTPRFSSIGYGANIKMNMPSNNMLATPKNPVAQQQQYSFVPPDLPPQQRVVEKFSPSCNNGLSSSNNISQSTVGSGSGGTTVTSSFSNSTPAMLGFGDGIEAPVIVTNELMWANSKSNLRSQGDWIRGDLAIVPCEPGWFRPSVVPSRDLQSGALAVMGGMQGGSAVASLMSKNSAGLISTFGGTTFGTNDITGNTSSVGTTAVSYTAFP